MVKITILFLCQLNAARYITGVINPVKKRGLKKRGLRRDLCRPQLDLFFWKKLTVFPYATKI